MYPLDNRTGPDRHRTRSDGYDFNDRDGVMMWEETGLDRSLIMSIKAWPTSPLTGSKSITISGRVFVRIRPGSWILVGHCHVTEGGQGGKCGHSIGLLVLVPGLPLPPFPVSNWGSSLKDTAVPPQFPQSSLPHDNRWAPCPPCSPTRNAVANDCDKQTYYYFLKRYLLVCCSQWFF